MRHSYCQAVVDVLLDRVEHMKLPAQSAAETGRAILMMFLRRELISQEQYDAHFGDLMDRIERALL